MNLVLIEAEQSVLHRLRVDQMFKECLLVQKLASGSTISMALRGFAEAKV